MHRPWISILIFGVILIGWGLGAMGYGGETSKPTPFMTIFTLVFLLFMSHLFCQQITITFDRHLDRVTRSRQHMLPFWPRPAVEDSIHLSEVKRAMTLSSQFGNHWTLTLVQEEDNSVESSPPHTEDVSVINPFKGWFQSSSPKPKRHWPLTDPTRNRVEWENGAEQINDWLDVGQR
ncbi:hypothetical protein C2W62_31520 [Candidatus Entotheonella serta]|nr:hypothetical protein C2W62_31520 [Candidatus Entotheonella serta]